MSRKSFERQIVEQSSITFEDGSKLDSATYNNYNHHIRKKLRVSDDATFDKDIIVKGKIKGELASLDPLSKEYTDEKTGWPWPIKGATYEKNNDSLWSHIDIIEKAPYASKLYVDDGNKNTLGFIRKTGEIDNTYPMFSNPSNNYTNPVMFLANNNSLIIRQDETTDQKLKIQIKGQTAVGKYLKCLNNDGDVGWGDGNFNVIIGDETVESNLGESTNYTLLLRDIYNSPNIPDINFYLNLPTNASNKNQLVTQGSIFTMYGKSGSGFSSNSQPESIIGVYSLGSEGIKFKSGFLNSNSEYVDGFSLIAGGVKSWKDQGILLNKDGIHIYSNQYSNNWGKVKILTRKNNSVDYRQPPNLTPLDGPLNLIRAELTVGEDINDDTMGITKLYGELYIKTKLGGELLTKPLFLKCNTFDGKSEWSVLPINYTLETTETFLIDGQFSFGNLSKESNINGSKLNINCITEIKNNLIVTGTSSFNNSITSNNSFTSNNSTNLNGTTNINNNFNFVSSNLNDKYYLANDNSTGKVVWKKLPNNNPTEIFKINSNLELYNAMFFINAGLAAAGVGAGIGYAIGNSSSGEFNGTNRSGYRIDMGDISTTYYWKIKDSLNNIYYPFRIRYHQNTANVLSIGNAYPPVADLGQFNNNEGNTSPTINAIDFFKDNKIITETNISYGGIPIPISPPGELRIAGKTYYRQWNGTNYNWPYSGDVLVGTGITYQPNHNGETYGEAKWTSIYDILPTTFMENLKFNGDINIGNTTSYTYTKNGQTITVPINGSKLDINGQLFFKYTPTNNIGNATLNHVLTCVDASTGELQLRPAQAITSPNLTVQTLTVQGGAYFQSQIYCQNNIVLRNFLICENGNDPITLTQHNLIQLDGISSNIQTQLNNKLNLSGGTITGNTTFNIQPKLKQNASINKFLKCINSDGSCEWSDVTLATGLDQNINILNVIDKFSIQNISKTNRITTDPILDYYQINLDPDLFTSNMNLIAPNSTEWTFTARDTDYILRSAWNNFAVISVPANNKKSTIIEFPIMLEHSWSYKDNFQQSDDCSFWYSLESVQIRIFQAGTSNKTHDFFVSNSKEIMFLHHDREQNQVQIGTSLQRIQSTSTWMLTKMILKNIKFESFFPLSDVVRQYSISFQATVKFRNNGDLIRNHFFGLKSRNTILQEIDSLNRTWGGYDIDYYNLNISPNTPAETQYADLLFTYAKWGATYAIDPIFDNNNRKAPVWIPPRISIGDYYNFNENLSILPYNIKEFQEFNELSCSKFSSAGNILSYNGVLGGCGFYCRKGYPTTFNPTTQGVTYNDCNYKGEHFGSSTNWGNIFNIWWDGQVKFYIDYSHVISLSPNTSDYRIKSNLVLMEPVLERLYNINLFSYEKNDITSTKIEKNHIGFLAHEVQEMFPEYEHIISGEKDGEEIQMVNYNEVSILLLKGIQELTEEVKFLKNELLIRDEKIAAIETTLQKILLGQLSFR